MDVTTLTLTILLVDDEPDCLDVAQQVLHYLGATVHQASSGQEALTILETLTPDVVLSDISMSVMDGYELFTRIRAKHPTLPIIALTANAMDGDCEAILQHGFSGYVSKPFEVFALAPYILTCLSAPAPKPTEPVNPVPSGN